MRKKIQEIIDKYSNVPEAKAIVDEVCEVEEEEFYKNHKPLTDIVNYEDYTRHLIQLNHSTVMMIHLFKKNFRHSIEEAWLDDNEKCCDAEYKCIKNSAHQLILQLEGLWCEAFIEQLRDECNKILETK